MNTVSWVRLRTALGPLILSLLAFPLVARAAHFVELAKISASDGELQDRFGLSAAVEGNRAIVGAPGDDDAGYSAGAAYFFEYDGSVWVERAKV